MTDINPLERYFIEKMSEANYGLWNALLTVNGIMVATFSLLIALSPRVNFTVACFLIANCSTSLLLILWNYLLTKWHYLAVGCRISNGQFDLTEQQRNEEIAQANRKRRLIILREYVAIVCVIFSVLLIALLL